MLGLEVVTRGSFVKPVEVIAMPWVELWPATKPTASSPALSGVTGPEEAELPVAAEPAEVSRNGSVVATPLNSWSWSATAVAPVVTVTPWTEAALGAYQSSPSEFAPETDLAITLVHVFLPSDTAAMGLLAPVKALADNTRRSPGVLAAGRVTEVVEEPATCTRAGPEGPPDVVTVTGGELGMDALPGPSRASTVYEYILDAVADVSE